MKTITMSHHKGGVGKTTTTANVGAALANLGHRVLLVDLDPQASLTNIVGAVSDPSSGFADEHVTLDDPASIEAHVQHLDAWGVDVVPAGTRLARRESSRQAGDEQLVRVCLEHLAGLGRWDIAVIDAPGSLGVLTQAGLVAATSGVVVPTTPDFLAIEPLRVILQLAGTINRAYQPGCQLVGLIVNAVTGTNEHRSGIRDIEAAFPDHAISPVVPRLTVVQEAAGAGRALTATKGPSAARCAEIYRQIAGQIWERTA